MPRTGRQTTATRWREQLLGVGVGAERNQRGGGSQRVTPYLSPIPHSRNDVTPRIGKRRSRVIINIIDVTEVYLENGAHPTLPDPT